MMSICIRRASTTNSSPSNKQGEGGLAGVPHLTVHVSDELVYEWVIHALIGWQCGQLHSAWVADKIKRVDDSVRRVSEVHYVVYSSTVDWVHSEWSIEAKTKSTSTYRNYQSVIMWLWSCDRDRVTALSRIYLVTSRSQLECKVRRTAWVARRGSGSRWSHARLTRCTRVSPSFFRLESKYSVSQSRGMSSVNNTKGASGGGATNQTAAFMTSLTSQRAHVAG